MKNHPYTFASIESLSNNVKDIWKSRLPGPVILFHRFGKVDLFDTFSVSFVIFFCDTLDIWRDLFASIQSLSNKVLGTRILSEHLGSTVMYSVFPRFWKIYFFGLIRGKFVSPFLLWHAKWLKGHICFDRINIK